MSAVVGSFLVVVAAVLGFFIPSAAAYGWPEKDFFHELPEKVKSVIVGVTAIILHFPVLVSFVFYFVLLRSVKKSPKVDPAGGLVGLGAPSGGMRNEPALNSDISVVKRAPDRPASSLEPSPKDTTDQERLRKLADEELWNQKIIQKNQEELSATIKSIQTNFVIIVSGITCGILTKLLPVDYQVVFNIGTNAVMKVVLPLATTFVNFAVVRRAAVAFVNAAWRACSRLCHPDSN